MIGPYREAYSLAMRWQDFITVTPYVRSGNPASRFQSAALGS
jgi:hypothetical protein